MWQSSVKVAIWLSSLPHAKIVTMSRGREFSQMVAIELVAEGKRRKITQKRIAEAAGVGEVQMSQYVHAKRGSMTAAMILSACEMIGVDPEVIVQRAYARLVDQRGPRPQQDRAIPTGATERLRAEVADDAIVLKARTRQQPRD